MAAISDDECRHQVDFDHVAEGRGRCAIALTPFRAGDVVLEEAPAHWTMLPSRSSSRCARCFRPKSGTTRIRTCGKCHRVGYCSVSCQRAAWGTHKAECRSLAALGHDDALMPKLMLAARVLRGRHRGDPRQERVADLHTGGNATKECVESAAMGLAVPGLMPDGTTPEELATLLQQFDKNNFAILDDLLVVVGMGVYPFAARLNHSCAPNCVLSFEGTPADGPRLLVRAVRDVAAGEELTHSYVDLCTTTPERRAQLQATHGFLCTCSRCSEGLVFGSVDVERALTSEDVIAATERKALIAQATDLQRQAAAEESIDAELVLLKTAQRLLKPALHRYDVALYKLNGLLLTLHLLRGDVSASLTACRELVHFQKAVLSQVGAHPLLGLQLFTLADLHRSSGGQSEEAEALSSALAILTTTQGPESPLAVAAASRLAERSG